MPDYEWEERCVQCGLRYSHKWERAIQCECVDQWLRDIENGEPNLTPCPVGAVMVVYEEHV